MLKKTKMVSAHGDGGHGRTRTASQLGPETTQLHRDLILSGATRENIREVLCNLAQHYISLAEAKDADRSVIHEDGLNLQTWKMPYTHSSYNPAPPFILQLPDLHVYVTRAHVPNLTVE